jgi:tRNA(fMet)-specific endonuclease VapC
VYVFDTDVLSLVMRGALPAWAERRLRAVERERCFTTSVSLGELWYGAIRSGSVARWRDQIEALLREFTCLHFEAEAAQRYAQVRVDLERQGKRLADPDLRIAAICLARDRILVSGNERHFARIPGLRYENWLRRGSK